MKRAFGKPVLLVLYFVLLITPIWITKYPAILDYPDHLLRVKIARDLHRPDLDYAKYYQHTWSGLRTYYFFDGITYLLSFPFGVFNAGKLTLSIYVALMLAAGLALLRSGGQPFWPFGLWPAIFVYNWWYSGGSVDLVAGYAFAILGIAAFVSNLPARTKRVLLASAFLASAAAHPLAFLLGVAVLLWLGLDKIADRVLRICLTILYVVIILTASILSRAYFEAPFDLSATLNRTLWLLHDQHPSVEESLLLLILGIVSVVWILGTWRRPNRKALLPAFLAGLAFLVPPWVLHIGFNEMRIVLFGLILVPLSVSAPLPKLGRLGLTVLLLITAFVWNLGQVQKQLSFKPFFTELDEVVSALPSRSRVRPIVDFTGSPEQKAFHYCAFYKGGYTPHMLVSPFCGLAYAKEFSTLGANMGDPDSTELARYDALLLYRAKSKPAHSYPNYHSAFSGKFFELQIRAKPQEVIGYP